MKSPNTDELNTELSQAQSLEQFLEKNQDCFQIQELIPALESMLREKNLTKSTVARQAGMSEVYLHQIFSGRRNPSRTRLICICIGMEASLDETQELLRLSGQATLYPKVRRDAIIMYGILHKMELFAINDLLFDADENTLI